MRTDALDERKPITIGLALSIISIVCVPAAGFGVMVLQKLNSIETSLKLMSKDLSLQTGRIDGNVPWIALDAWTKELRALNRGVIEVPEVRR